MMVKICGITTREDAVAAVEAGASALGFNFYPKSPRYISPETAAELGRGLRVLKVGVFAGQAPEHVKAVAGRAGLDVVQLHGEEQPTGFEGLRVWKAFRVTPGWSRGILANYAGAEAYLLDGAAPGTGEVFDWELAAGLNARVVLAGGLDADNVAAAIRAVRPWGVDACSRLEKAPGIKDQDKVARFIRAAQTDFL